MKHFIKAFAYVFMFSLSLIGYICLPDMIKMWRLGCTFMSITDKKIVSSGSDKANLYSLDGGYNVWDRMDYKTGDIVCVNMQM